MANNMPPGIEPRLLWKHFDTIRSIPHGSGNEKALRTALRDWATTRGLVHVTDATGNLLIQVPATPGREAESPTVLQGHLDMVCEKNADVDHDFDTDALRLKLEGQWLSALGTTLGADNGIGVAAALALAEDPAAQHGPLEILLTVDEETGMTGAWGLEPGFLKGKRLLNLDTEEEGAVYVGCAGGGDTYSRFTISWEPCPARHSLVKLAVSGLLGGHSGLDIHENRANAIKCLARLLAAARESGIDFRLQQIQGGSMRNAIPREASCTVLVDSTQTETTTEAFSAEAQILKSEFAATDPDMTLHWNVTTPGVPCSTFSMDLTTTVLHSLLANPSGVLAMSKDVPGLVETSNNLGVVQTKGNTLEIVNCSRSSVNSALGDLRRTLKSIYHLAGAQVETDAPYPGWQPDLDSPLLATVLKVHENLFGKKARVMAVHAGLECGLIGQHFPGMAMVSIGPDIRGAHSPDERVHVGSTANFYTFLKAILADLR